MRLLPRFTVRRLMVAVVFVAIIYAIGSYGDRHRRPAVAPILGTITGIFPPMGLFDDKLEELLLPIPVALGAFVVGSIVLVRSARRREQAHRRLRPRERLDAPPA